ncbi:serine hydrolase domain-containing protein [Amycolatopsis australiensis]|uniref:CubicO group peptidase, beta-lactamase class C family n=1 Tax=Amycolatopsis australiensis TaxID=546364 RepID=A0A1K1SWR6_9PSEU|nr:serine hydrolase domain-containing protein [Amycolatopsis australiensis]SFW88832.1 CubicO group peptidase, beta-lactamase class C family [Amycolatopsis australiensis]
MQFRRDGQDDVHRSSHFRPVPAARLDALLARLARRYRVPGAQLAVAQGDDVTFAQTGVRHRDRPEPMLAGSAVPVGSVTKLATATLAMVLVADGDLDLDEPVGDVLGAPGLPVSLTTRRLLSHTSGLPSDPAETAGPLPKELRSAAPVCPPGTAFSYSNLGYALVGSVIEAVTGMGWREAVDAVVLRPLKIDPVFVGDTAVVSGHAGDRPVEQVLPPMLDAAGALAMSATDLVALGRVHLGKPGLLDVVTAADMHRRVPVAAPFGLADGWGLGIAHFGDEDTGWLGHDGTADGTSCHLRIDQAGACVVALTANGTTGVDLWHALAGELGELGVELPPRPGRSAAASTIPFPAGDFGTYRNGAIDYAITPDEGGARLVVDGEVFPGLVLHADRTFTVRDPATGRVTPCGRFHGEPGAATAVEIGGRLAARC